MKTYEITINDMRYALKLRAESIEAHRPRALALACLETMKDECVLEAYWDMVDADSEGEEL